MYDDLKNEINRLIGVMERSNEHDAVTALGLLANALEYARNLEERLVKLEGRQQ